MVVRRLIPIAVLLLTAALATGQMDRRDAHIGYLYPAGGQQGSVVRITAGGQNLRGASAAYICGTGAHAAVIEYIRPLTPKDLQAAVVYIKALIKQRWPALAARADGGQPAPKKNAPAGQPEPLPPKPDHPLLRDLDKKTLPELAVLREQFFNPKKQRNTQLAETVIVEVTLDANAAPGDRELRLQTAAGLSNPMVFQVGCLPEVREQEPNDPKGNAPKPGFPPPPPQPVWDLPVVMNGQIQPGDVDRFRFRARKGQQLVVQAQARHLIPYLADAVPGWCQAVVALYDAKGSELSSADDYRFDPDPVLFYPVPADGEYELEIRDAIYRGRDDFVYRVKVGEEPFITQVFPLGGRIGAQTVAEIGGWNLPQKQLPLDTQAGATGIRQTALCQEKLVSNGVIYAVDDLPECDEVEPNDVGTKAQAIELPRIVNGRIGKPGDVDVCRFQGRAGEEVAIDVLARRLNSPLDSLVRLIDAGGKVEAWNDDHEDKEEGLLTHQADSHLSAKLPASGTYYVKLTDSEGHGGDAYAYRMRVSEPRPSFALRVTPSSLTLPGGRPAEVSVYAVRKDGFEGDIEVKLKDAPAGLTLQGGRIPAGRERVRMTLAGPARGFNQPFALHVEGSAQIGGKTVTCLAVPAEDMMQAFAYRHLVPSQELLAEVTPAGRFAATIELVGPLPVRIPAGGVVRVQINAPVLRMLPGLKLELNAPPDGVTLDNVTVVAAGLTLTLKAGAEAPRVGYQDNLIVEASMEMDSKGKAGAAGEKRRVSVGVLPAIPFEVVKG